MILIVLTLKRFKKIKTTFSLGLGMDKNIGAVRELNSEIKYHFATVL